MASVEEQCVIEEINLLMGMQFSFCRSIKRSSDDIKRFENSIAKLADEIKELEDRLWWIQFIRFCNTPCYKFKL